MFKRREKRASTTPQLELFTYIHHGTAVNGELEGTGRVRIHGTVRGNVRVDGVLEVAEAGVVEGAWIVADEVKIIGRVQVESLTAHGKVEIWRGGELIGDVKAASLDIEEGAHFTGRSQMTDQSGAVTGGHHGAEQVQQATTEPEDRPQAADVDQRPTNATSEPLSPSDDATF